MGPSQGDQLLVPLILCREIAIADQGIGGPQGILAVHMAVTVTAEYLIFGV